MNELNDIVIEFCQKIGLILRDPISVRLIKMAFPKTTFSSLNMYWHSEILQSVITVDTANYAFYTCPEKTFKYDPSVSLPLLDPRLILQVIIEITDSSLVAAGKFIDVENQLFDLMRFDLLCAMATDILITPAMNYFLPIGCFIDKNSEILYWSDFSGETYRFDPKNLSIKVSIDGEEGPFIDIPYGDLEKVFSSVAGFFKSDSPFGTLLPSVSMNHTKFSPN
jgi:hypothetical protein